MKTLGKDFVISLHAQQQMLKRNIAVEWIEKALNKPDVISEEPGKQIYQVMVSEQYLLRVIVNDIASPNIVITVYITSKIKKYNEGKI
jgi:hypothetical protein